MFALAANGFNKPSETFIRSHARHLAPEQTLLIAERRERQIPIAAPLVMFSKRFPILVSQNASTGWSIFAGLSPARFIQSRDAYLAAILKQYNVRTIMCEYGPVAIHLVEAARLAECELFVHFHGVDASKMLRNRDVVRDYQKLFEQAAGIIAPSAFLAKNLAGVGCPTEKLHVVPCGVDTSAFEPGTPEPLALLSVGRFTEKKSPLSTIAAFALVKETHPQATLQMMGDGPLFAEARAEVKRLNLEASVTFPGLVTPVQVQAAMRNAAIFLQHSVTSQDGDIEGLPVAILEAMATGLPVVSTLHSGIPEAVINGETGLLVPEFDVEGMATSIKTLLDDPKLARSYGLTGRQRVIHAFSERVTIRKLQNIMNLSSLPQSAEP